MVQPLHEVFEQTQRDLQSKNSDEIVKDYAHIIYKTSAKNVGTEAAKVTPERPILHGFNGKFSSHLAASGMPANNGLNCHVERERVIDYSKDWQDKNI